MPSEWAMEQVEKSLRKFDFSESWGDSSVARAIDAARIEGLKEAAKIAKSCVSGYGAAHYIRARIEEIKG